MNWENFSDRLDWALDRIVLPLFFLFAFTLFTLIFLALIVVGIAALIWWAI